MELSDTLVHYGLKAFHHCVLSSLVVVEEQRSNRMYDEGKSWEFPFSHRNVMDVRCVTNY